MEDKNFNPHLFCVQNYHLKSPIPNYSVSSDRNGVSRVLTSSLGIVIFVLLLQLVVNVMDFGYRLDQLLTELWHRLQVFGDGISL